MMLFVGTKHCPPDDDPSIMVGKAPPSNGKSRAPPPEAPDNEDPAPELSPVDDSEGEGEEENSRSSVYDSEDGLHDNGTDGSDVDEDYDEDDDDDDDEFEDQGSSDDDEDRLERQKNEEDSDDDEIAVSYEKEPRSWSRSSVPASNRQPKKRAAGTSTAATEVDTPTDSIKNQAASATLMHTDDWSSDDDDVEGKQNRIGRVPLHWYDDYDHIGYDAHGDKVIKTSSGDRIDQALALQDNRAQGKFVVHDALNDRDVELSQRQLELIRRVQHGAFAHPEHEANPDYIDYFSGVDQQISGLHSNRLEPKARFQPSKWEQLQVDKLLQKLQEGKISMDYLTGKVRDMNDTNKKDPKKPYLIWKGDEEDELNMRKGPQHIPPPKLPPPGHAESYIPPDEYLPTEEDLKKWEDMEAKERPHGHLIPKRFPNLRSVGAYQHSVREAFERCLDLYLCPRVLKRRLNIDPESLVPRLPKASDLRPFPTAKCIEYKTPLEGESVAPVIRCVAASPDGQFMASGASDGYLRMWEVQTGRLLRSWNLFDAISSLDSDRSEEDTIKPVVCIEWNPNRSHHCLLAAVGKYVCIVATGTANQTDAEITEALLSAAASGGDVTNTKAKKAVKWFELKGQSSTSCISAYDHTIGPICAIQTPGEVASMRWQVKGDYFLSVSPKAAASAVLIHQLSKGNSQQPFSKSKGEAQVACFHPNKPFL